MVVKTILFQDCKNYCIVLIPILLIKLPDSYMDYYLINKIASFHNEIIRVKKNSFHPLLG